MFLYLWFFVMGREEKIQAIYEDMANKELTLWCKARIYYTDYPNLADKYFWDTTKYIEVVLIGNSYFEDWQIVKYKELENSFLEEDCCGFWVFNPIILQNYRACFFKNIWRPVMIGDVISYLRNPFDKFIEWQPIGEHWLVDSYSKNMNNLLVKWTDTSSSIDEQDDECVSFVYSLIKN